MTCLQQSTSRTHISKYQSGRVTGDFSGLTSTAKPLNSVSSPLASHWLPQLHQVYGRSFGASAAAGFQGNEVPGRLADMRSDRTAVSLSSKNAVVTHLEPGIVYQQQKVQPAASSDHPVPRYVAGCQDGIGENDTRQTGPPQRLPCALLSRYQSHLEAVSHGCCCAGGSACSSAHAASAEVSLQSGPVPTERPTGYSAGHQEIVWPSDGGRCQGTSQEAAGWVQSCVGR